MHNDYPRAGLYAVYLFTRRAVCVSFFPGTNLATGSPYSWTRGRCAGGGYGKPTASDGDLREFEYSERNRPLGGV